MQRRYCQQVIVVVVVVVVVVVFVVVVAVVVVVVVVVSQNYYYQAQADRQANFTDINRSRVNRGPLVLDCHVELVIRESRIGTRLTFLRKYEVYT